MIVTLETDENGDLVLPLGDEIFADLGWQIGDTVEWIDNEDGSWTLRKKEVKTEMVLVECVSTFRMRYVVEVPLGKKEWALDTVTMNEAEEFSQEHIGEQIVSHRVIDMTEYDRLFAEDNSYLNKWTDEQKRGFITPLPEDEIEHSEHFYDTDRNK
jgi:hypothetical protein